MSRLYLWMALGLAVVATGCAELQDLAIASRNRNAAYSAWKAARWDYWRQGVPYRTREHISRGFRQGYYDVAGGGSGKVPLFPPHDYWGVRYQTPAGNELVAAWFRGYRDGAMAAERDGVGYFNQIPASSAPPQSNPYAAGPIGPWNIDNAESIPAPPSVDPVMPVPPVLDGPNAVRMPATQESVPLKVLDQPAPPVTLPLPTPRLDAPAPATVPGSAVEGVKPTAPNVTSAPTPPPAAPAANPLPAGAPKVDQPEPAKPTVPVKPPVPANPSVPAPPAGEPARPRDPIGGKQAGAEPGTTTPLAQQALFGESAR